MFECGRLHVWCVRVCAHACEMYVRICGLCACVHGVTFACEHVVCVCGACGMYVCVVCVHAWCVCVHGVCACVCGVCVCTNLPSKGEVVFTVEDFPVHPLTNWLLVFLSAFILVKIIHL